MAEQEWKPIETAPKDGTDLVLYCGPPDDPLLGIGYWETERETEDGWYLWHKPMQRCLWPTHWAPIPPFPIPSTAA